MKQSFRLVDYINLNKGDIVRYTIDMVTSYSMKVINTSWDWIELDGKGIIEGCDCDKFTWQRLEEVSTYRFQDSCANCKNIDYPLCDYCTIENKKIRASGICDRYIKKVKEQTND